MATPENSQLQSLITADPLVIIQPGEFKLKVKVKEQTVQEVHYHLY